MNRKVRRKMQAEGKKQGKKKFTLMQLQKAFSVALEMKKESRGHLFKSHLKERCVFCGADRKTKNDCDYWFLTYIDRVQTILINPQFFNNDDEQANWLQHGDEYAEIKVPRKKDIK